MHEYVILQPEIDTEYSCTLDLMNIQYSEELCFSGSDVVI